MEDHVTNLRLIGELQQGSEEAFAGVYHQYHQAVLANICRLVPHPHEAEDILQEVFITLWNKRLKLTPDHSVAGWLFSTSYYKSLEFIKKRIRQSVVPFTDTLNEAFVLDEEPSQAEKDYLDKLSLLTDAIELLPTRKKLAFKLCRLEGKSYEEIALALNISAGSARDYVKSASRQLRKYIEAKNLPAQTVGLSLLAIFLL